MPTESLLETFPRLSGGHLLLCVIIEPATCRDRRWLLVRGAAYGRGYIPWKPSSAVYDSQALIQNWCCRGLWGRYIDKRLMVAGKPSRCGIEDRVFLGESWGPTAPVLKTRPVPRRFKGWAWEVGRCWGLGWSGRLGVWIPKAVSV